MDARAALPGVLDACAAWRPDVVVSEPAEFAGRLAAAHRGLPLVSVSITQFAVEHRMRAAMGAALRRLRSEHRLAGPNGAGFARFTLMPPLLEHPAVPGPAGIQRFREPDGPPPAPLPDWWGGASDPLVYVTFGSVAAQRDDVFPGLFRAAIAALGPLPVRVLVTIGREREPRRARRAARERPCRALGAAGERHAPRAGDGEPRRQRHAPRRPRGRSPPGRAAAVRRSAGQRRARRRARSRHRARAGTGVPARMAAAVRAVLADFRYAERAAAVAADIRALPPVDLAAARLRGLAGGKAD